MSKKQKKQLTLILVSLLLFVGALLFGLLTDFPWYVKLLVMAVPYLVAGGEVLFEAAEKLFSGEVFDENLLMSIASLGALALCIIEKDAHEAHEAAAIMIFYRVGELFESIAVGKSRKNVAALLDMMPDKATVERDGKRFVVSPEEVLPGETLVILPGEKIPLDGTVLEGVSDLDTAPLTGESLPRRVDIGGEVLSGCINLSGLLRVKVTKPFFESTASKITELVETAGINKSKSENFISVFSRYYTPLVTLAALLLALVPSLFVGFSSGNWSFAETFKPFVHAALMFLIVSCPCALVISVPMTFFGGIGSACSKGILIKGSAFVESLSKCRTSIFDKTGTLTSGKFTLSEVRPQHISKEELLFFAAAAEQYSTHPVGKAVMEAYSGVPAEISDCTELPGRGIRCSLSGKVLLSGNRRLMEENGISLPADLEDGSVIHLALDGIYLGSLSVKDELKKDSASAFADLKALSCRRIILTGDRKSNTEKAVKALLPDEVFSELLPEDKWKIVSDLAAHKEAGTTVCFVGDGINDAPALAGADVGIAMGALGSDAAIEAADVVLMNDRPSDVPRAIAICKKTMKLVKENVILALSVKFAVLILLALMTFIPALSPLENYAGEFAVFADVGVSVLAILNAMRAM